MSDRIELVNLDGSRSQLFKGPDELETITLATIMQGLDRVPRFRGQTRVPWFIGHHMVLCGMIAERRRASLGSLLATLLHDVGEAVIGLDVPTPLKKLLYVRTRTGWLRYDDFETEVRSRCVRMLIPDQTLASFVIESMRSIVLERADHTALVIEASLLVSPEFGTELAGGRPVAITMVDAARSIEEAEGITLQEFFDLRDDKYPSAMWLQWVNRLIGFSAKPEGV